MSNRASGGRTLRRPWGGAGLWAWLCAWLVAGLALPVGLGGCERGAPTPAPGRGSPAAGPTGPKAPPAGTLELVFAYGSEKKLWIDEATAAFNAAGRKTGSGKLIRVDARAMGSGESIDETLAGHLRAHLVSPASAAFITLGNARSRAEKGVDLVGPTQDLVLSPVVIAMWKPMAEKLGWPERPIGWADILAMAKDDQGWAAKGAPQWGRFKFGHTHPQYSNSGLISVIAETYAATGKVAGLTLEDLQKPETRAYVEAIERAVVHYGESTGFFGRKMFENGPQYLSAAVLYENMVIESYGGVAPVATARPEFPVVAIYPREGTFWSEHPVGVVQREWVSDEHREAAKAYIDDLLSRPRQERAMAMGFRPSDVSIPLGAPIDAAHGVDPQEPRTVLEVPPADVIGAVIDLWKVAKKKSNVVLVLDTSGSMKEEQRMPNAKAGAARLLEMMGDEDTFSLLTFNNQLSWTQEAVLLRDGRAQAVGYVNSLFPQGGTALYDAVAAAWRRLETTGKPDQITAIVVLSDGADTDSKTKLNDLLRMVQSNVESRPTRVFTIGYGKGANMKVLKQIADGTNAKSYEGNAENIRQIFKEIATFF